MLSNYIILMMRKARSWSASFMVNLFGLILGLTLVELIFLQFLNQYRIHETAWQPSLLLALIVLALVVINFANFTTMQLKNRLRESGVRKLLGASNTQMVTQYLTESIAIVFGAVLLSMIMTELVQPWFDQLFNLSYSLREQSIGIQLFIVTFLVIVVSILGSAYPIWKFARITMGDIMNQLKK